MNIHAAYQDGPKTITCFLGFLTFDLLGPFGLLLEPFVGLVVLGLLVVVVLGLLVGVGLLVVLCLLVVFGLCVVFGFLVVLGLVGLKFPTV